jgi:hypothetical protein
MKRRSAALLIGFSLFVGGCATEIPAKMQVTDVSSGKTYTTYEPWGKVDKGIGYKFTDIDTGKQITLTNYELKQVESKKSVPGDSPEATAYKQAQSRTGMD